MDLETVMGDINPFFFSFFLLIPLLFLIFKQNSIKGARLPPGPFPLPIIGNIHQILDRNPHVKLAEIAKVHGPLISLRLGRQVLIVGSSPAVAMEILKTHDRALCGRFVPLTHPVESPKLNHLSLGFAGECSDSWKNLRAFCQSELFSTKAVDSQAKIREKKVVEMVRYLGGKKDEVVNIGEIIFSAMFNMLTNVLFSKDVVDFEAKGEGRLPMMKLIKKNLELFFFPNVSEFYPMLRAMDVQGLEKKSAQLYKTIFPIWENIVNERRKQRSDGDFSSGRDFLDCMLQIGFSNQQIIILFQELMMAATDTGTRTSERIMAELLKNPEAMRKLHDELAEKLGDEIVKDSDLPHLPYLNACVKEIFRFHPAAATLLPHRALETCKIMGYTIPKGSKVFVNMWAMGRDPTIWEDPSSFKPERFLNSELSYTGKDYAYIPFGSGRRICQGIQMASRVIPLIIASLVQSFDWVLPDNMDPTKPEMGKKIDRALDTEQPLNLISKARN